MVLHFDPFLLEMRVASSNIPVFKEAFLNIIDSTNKGVEWIPTGVDNMVYSELENQVLNGLVKHLNKAYPGDACKLLLTTILTTKNEIIFQ